MVRADGIRRVVLSGCSGGGKSCLLAELAVRGFETFPEPGRLIVQEQLASGGAALPWVDEAEFARLALARAMEFYEAAQGPVSFFDRSYLEAFIGLTRLRQPVPQEYATVLTDHRYSDDVFLTPPWPEIYELDEGRKHSLQDAISEYEALCRFLPENGYAVHVLPKVSVEERADFVLNKLGVA